MPHRLPEEWRVPAAFGLFVGGTAVFAMSHAWFWQRKHDVAWVALPLLLLVVAMLMRRSRLAWWLLALWAGSGIVVAVVSVSHVTGTWLAGNILGLIEFGLLLSPQMRRFVRLGGRSAPSPG